MMDNLPEIPEKKYFSITEVSDLCDLKAHTLRFWEKEFNQLKPVTRRGSRRFYQKKDILLVWKIRNLLYGDRMTISGARKILESRKDFKQDNLGFKEKTLQDLERILKEIKKIL